MEKKDKKLPRLFCVICVLIAIIGIGILALPIMSSVREKAFRIEATNIVEAAKDAKKLYDDGNLNFGSTNVEKQQKCITSTKACFTISSLIEAKTYKNDNSNFNGKVEIDFTDSNNPVYTLWLQKGDEFRFVNLKYTNYKEDGTINNDSWQASYNTCTC